MPLAGGPPAEFQIWRRKVAERGRGRAVLVRMGVPRDGVMVMVGEDVVVQGSGVKGCTLAPESAQTESKHGSPMEVDEPFVRTKGEERVRVNERKLYEKCWIARISRSLENMVEDGNEGRGVAPTRCMQVLSNSSGHQVQIEFFLQKLVDTMNLHDIEMSDPNPLAKTHSLGFRLLLCSLVIIDRIFSAEPGFRLTRCNIKCTVTVCMMLASKFSEDEPFNNKFWGSLARIPLSDMNKAELELVQILNYNFRVSESAFVALLRQLGIHST